MGKEKIGRNTLFILLIILLLALFIRLYSLNVENISSDEGLTIYHSQKSIIHNIQWSLSGDYVPFYHVLLSLWVSIFDVTEFNVRILSVFFGVLSVYMIYLVASLLFNKRVGVYSALILALSSFNIYFSQEARPYPLYLFLALSSIYFYLRYVKENKFAFWYILSTSLLLYTHGIALLVVVFQNIYHFFVIRRNLKNWVFIQFIVFLIFSPLLYFVVKEALRFSSSNLLWVSTPSLVGVMKFFYVFSSGVVFTLNHLIFGSILALLFGVLILFFIIKVSKKIKDASKSNIENILFVLLWLIVPIAGLIVVSFLFTSLFVEKYIIFSSASLYILVALSVSRLHKSIQAFMIFAIALLSVIVLYNDFTTVNNSEWRDASLYIKSRMGPGDGIVVNVYTAKYVFSYYFNQYIFKSQNITSQLAVKGIYGARNADELPEDIINKTDVWLVLHNSQYQDTQGTLFSYFSSNYKLAEYKKFRGIAVYHFSTTSSVEVPFPEDYKASQYPDEKLSSLKTLIRK